MNVEELSSQAEKLTKLITAFKAELGDMDARDKQLKEYDFRLVEKNKALSNKAEALSIRYDELQEKQAYIKRIQTEQDAREGYIKAEMKILDNKKLSIDKENKELEDKKKMVIEMIGKLTELQEISDRLKEERTIIEKEKVLGRERSAILDMRERKIEAEQKRLQELSDSMK